MTFDGLDLAQQDNQTRLLAEHGAAFRFDSAWNSYGEKAGKRPIQDDWQNKPHTVDEALAHHRAAATYPFLSAHSPTA